MIYEMTQGSAEWMQVRKGKLTASHAQAIASNGKGLETYIYDILTEKYSSNQEQYTNDDIARGNELEETARELYQLETGNKVKQVGFIARDEFVGCSPDGLVGQEGGIEIKCLNDRNHLHLSITEKIEKKHIWQIQMNLLITNRNWWDYVAFNPNLPKELVIIRVEPDQEMHEKLREGIEKGIKQLKKLEKEYERIRERFLLQ